MENQNLKNNLENNTLKNETDEKTNFTKIIQLIKLILSTDENFNKLISNAKINIPSKQIKQIKNILNYLITQTKYENELPIVKIVQEILDILSDNKIELHEIPKLINLIHESFKNFETIKITSNDIGIIIKLILFILVETKTLKIKDDDYELFLSVIDTSMILLNKSVEIKMPKIHKCKCF